MDRVHHKNHSDLGEGEIRSVSWSTKRGIWAGWRRTVGVIIENSIQGGSLYVPTTPLLDTEAMIF